MVRPPGSCGMSDPKRRLRPVRGVAIALLAVATVVTALYTLDRQRHAADYAFSDLHWEFNERPKPWDEATKADYAHRCVAIARQYPEHPVAFAALHSAVVNGDSRVALGPFKGQLAKA